MKKTIFKYWLGNISFGILLYLIYRIIISQSESAGNTGFEKFMFIVEILLNLGYSLLYLAGVLLSSLTIFLNHFVKIRNNFYLSMLTFLGIPLVCVIYLLFIYLKLDYYSHNILLKAVLFSGIYLVFTGAQLWMFRRKIIISENK